MVSGGILSQICSSLRSTSVESLGELGPWFMRLPVHDLGSPQRVSTVIGQLLSKLAHRPQLLLLESADNNRIHAFGSSDYPHSRYSFLMSDPIQWKATRACRLQDWLELQATVTCFRTSPLPADFPPFAGGVAGLLSYDWCRAIERIPTSRRDDFQTPNLALGIYDHLYAFDHQENCLYLIANGFPAQTISDRKAKATCQFNGMIEQLRDDNGDRAANRNIDLYSSTKLDLSCYPKVQPHDDLLSFESSIELRSGYSFEAYYESILQVKEYLRAGDAFQVNLAQHLVTPLSDLPIDLYLKMRQVNPSPHAVYFDLGHHQLVSASPERLFCVRGNQAQTRPIKGTCLRTGDPQVDAGLAEQLLTSEKNCAENIMIVDLLRNDLSKVCLPESLRVSQLCTLEPYQFVQHLTSVISGQLPPNRSAWDLIPAMFPGGSISGAPKVRAMEIINELEPVARGAYCGSVGYIGFPNVKNQANADWNILIRTVTTCGRWCQIPVGGGIVLDSDPTSEFQETFVKAKGMLAACLANPWAMSSAAPPANQP